MINNNFTICISNGQIINYDYEFNSYYDYEKFTGMNIIIHDSEQSSELFTYLLQTSCKKIIVLDILNKISGKINRIYDGGFIETLFCKKSEYRLDIYKSFLDNYLNKNFKKEKAYYKLNLNFIENIDLQELHINNIENLKSDLDADKINAKRYFLLCNLLSLYKLIDINPENFLENCYFSFI